MRVRAAVIYRLTAGAVVISTALLTAGAFFISAKNNADSPVLFSMIGHIPARGVESIPDEPIPHTEVPQFILDREREELERLEEEERKREEERREQERLEQERLEQERLERERLEQERLEREKLKPSYFDNQLPESAAVDDDFFSKAVFIGDSRMVGFCNSAGLSKYCYAAVSLNIKTVLTQSIITDTSGGTTVTRTVLEMLNAHPDWYDKVYIGFGINEYSMLGTSFVKCYEYFIGQIRAALGDDIPIYVEAVFPVNEEKALAKGYKVTNEAVRDKNLLLADLTKRLDVYFVNIAEAVCKEDCFELIDNASNDGVHVGYAANLQIASYLKTHTKAASEIPTDEIILPPEPETTETDNTEDKTDNSTVWETNTVKETTVKETAEETEKETAEDTGKSTEKDIMTDTGEESGEQKNHETESTAETTGTPETTGVSDPFEEDERDAAETEDSAGTEGDSSENAVEDTINPDVIGGIRDM